MDRDNDLYRWTITPHLDSQYDSFVTNCDQDANSYIKQVAEMHLWDDMPDDEGQVTRTLKVTFNPDVPNQL